MESAEKLVARSLIYKLLSSAYYPPEESLLKGDFPGRLRSALNILEPGLLASEVEKIESYLRDLGEPLELAVEYTRLFRGPVKTEAYPYESMYVDGEIMGASALDVLRRYEEAGVAVSDDFKDLPDHVAAELEFMHYLTVKELEAWQREDQGEAVRFQLLARSFLKDHLARWVSDFADRILRSATTPFYSNLARITKGFVAREHLRCQHDSQSSPLSANRKAGRPLSWRS